MTNDSPRVCYVCGEEVVPWRCEDCDAQAEREVTNKPPALDRVCVEHHRHTMSGGAYVETDALHALRTMPVRYEAGTVFQVPVRGIRRMG